jgi:PTS system nitrogen regulatory IIA component
MDLKLGEVSRLLNVSESKVKKWVQAKKIPSYKLGSEFLFSRAEIEDWVMKNGPKYADESQESFQITETLEEEEEIKRFGIQHFNLYRAINKGGVFLDCNGQTKEEIIYWTTKKLAEKFNWDPDVIAELLIDREKLMPTALNNGIGVPHTRDFLINNHFDVCACVFLEHPIEYGALDGKPVNTLFFLFACEDKRHLNLLAKLAHLSSQEGSLKFFNERPSQKEFLDYVKNFESTLVHNK